MLTTWRRSTGLTGVPAQSAAGSTPTRPPAPSPRFTIDLAAVAANVGRVAERAPAVLAVVPADGFSHGAEDRSPCTA